MRSLLMSSVPRGRELGVKTAKRSGPGGMGVHGGVRVLRFRQSRRLGLAGTRVVAFTPEIGMRAWAACAFSAPYLTAWVSKALRAVSSCCGYTRMVERGHLSCMLLDELELDNHYLCI